MQPPAVNAEYTLACEALEWQAINRKKSQQLINVLVLDGRLDATERYSCQALL
jgi:hypothetical protein